MGSKDEKKAQEKASEDDAIGIAFIPPEMHEYLPEIQKKEKQQLFLQQTRR